MKYRTDLAIENQELLEQARTRAAGYIKKQRQIDEDISVIQIDIVSSEGEKAPRHLYNHRSRGNFGTKGRHKGENSQSVSSRT